MVWEAISKTQKSVSSGIQTPWSWLKKNSAVPLVFNPLLSVKYPDETLSCLTYYLKSFEPVDHEIGQNAAWIELGMGPFWSI